MGLDKELFENEMIFRCTMHDFRSGHADLGRHATEAPETGQTTKAADEHKSDDICRSPACAKDQGQQHYDARMAQR